MDHASLIRKIHGQIALTSSDMVESVVRDMHAYMRGMWWNFITQETYLKNGDLHINMYALDIPSAVPENWVFA